MVLLFTPVFFPPILHYFTWCAGSPEIFWNGAGGAKEGIRNIKSDSQCLKPAWAGSGYGLRLTSWTAMKEATIYLCGAVLVWYCPLKI